MPSHTGFLNALNNLNAGLPAWGTPLLQPCDLRLVLTAAGPPTGRHPTLTLSLHAPLLALQASPAMLAAARSLADAYTPMQPPPAQPVSNLAAVHAQSCSTLEGGDMGSEAVGLDCVPVGYGGGREGTIGRGRACGGPRALGEDDLRSGLFGPASAGSQLGEP